MVRVTSPHPAGTATANLYAHELLAGRGAAATPLPPAEVAATLAAGLRQLDLSGRRVLVLVPDGTRSIPLGELFATVYDTLAPQVAALDVLIALGTHQPMPPAAIDRRFDVPTGGFAARYPGVTVHNHAWRDPTTYLDLGTVSAAEVAALSGGLLAEEIPVRLNRLVADYDVCLVLGPVFPHEVVGFSGGNKYFFPGVSAPEVIDASHWLGALITSSRIIGTPGVTPVRQLIDLAAARIPARRLCAAVVVAPEGLGVHGVYVGTTEAAWAAAAALSAEVHVRYVERPFRRVVSVMPPMYDDIWTAAKGMYKVEPVVADGGEIIVYAPHVTTFSETHDGDIRRIGYHCRDYFLAKLREDPALFAGVPRGVIAHSTHLRGDGTYDPATGTEHGRVTVTLATGIPREDCEAVGLRWRDPATLDAGKLAEYAADPDTLVIPKAGELLYRLRHTSSP